VDGWKARYRSSAAEAAAAAVVESRVDLFDDSDGAGRELAAIRKEATGELGASGAVEPVEDLGDDGVMWTRPPLAGGNVGFVTVAWRYANVTASVVVNGAADSAPQRAIELARKQQQRLVSGGQS
jgi:hypothetical protein